MCNLEDFFVGALRTVNVKLPKSDQEIPLSAQISVGTFIGAKMRVALTPTVSVLATLQAAPHPVYTVVDNVHLLHTRHVSLAAALASVQTVSLDPIDLGEPITITLDPSVRIITSGSEVFFHGRGLHKPDGSGRGDLCVVFVVDMPDKLFLSPAEQATLRVLLSGGGPTQGAA